MGVEFSQMVIMKKCISISNRNVPFIGFVLSYYVSLCSEFRVVMSVMISAYKLSSVRLYLQFFLLSTHVLFTLFVFVDE